MTLLHDRALHAAMNDQIDRRLVITPLLDPDEQIGPGSVDLRLGTDFLLPRRTAEAGLDPGDPDAARRVLLAAHERFTVPLGDALWLHPDELLLGSTLEFVRLPADMAAYVQGRSSWGRVGLLPATATVVQPGYRGTLTFELVNEGPMPIRLWPGLRVAQLEVHRLQGPAKRPYSKKYVRPVGPEPSRGWEDKEIEIVTRLKMRFGASSRREHETARNGRG